MTFAAIKTVVRLCRRNALVAAVIGAAFAASHFAAADPPTLDLTLVTTFDHPNPSFHIYNIGGINNRGDIVGNVFSLRAAEPFVRRGNGAFTGFLPGPSPLPQAFGINRERTICGFYLPNQNGSVGFLLSGTTSTPYSVPGAFSTSITSINDQGHFAGDYETDDSTIFAFANIVGELITIPFPVIERSPTGLTMRETWSGITRVRDSCGGAMG